MSSAATKPTAATKSLLFKTLSTPQKIKLATSFDTKVKIIKKIKKGRGSVQDQSHLISEQPASSQPD